MDRTDGNNQSRSRALKNGRRTNISSTVISGAAGGAILGSFGGPIGTIVGAVAGATAMTAFDTSKNKMQR